MTTPISHTYNFQISLNPPIELVSIELEEAAIALEVNRWLEHSKKMNPISADLSKIVQGMAIDILHDLREMASNGTKSESIQKKARESIQLLNQSAECFIRNRAIYSEQKNELNQKITTLGDKITKKTKVDFESFE